MDDTPLHRLGARAAAAKIARGELRAVDLARACLDRIGERDGDVHAFACVDPDAVLRAARALDAGPQSGPLHGVPLGVKDLFDTADLPTACGSALYAGRRPGADAAAVALCRGAGALVAGKTVTTEFAYFEPGPTRNPHRLAHTPGGSSSGSAAAVAAGMVPLALGTQTAGSIIRPAAYCGVVGFKPSLGRVPRAGAKPLSETLDTVGGFARSVGDVALLASVLTGDPGLVACPAGGGRLRIGLCRTPHWNDADADVAHAWDAAVAALAPHAALADVEAPDLVALQRAVMAHEMALSLSHERLAARERLSKRLRALLDEGMTIDGAEHVRNLAAVAAARAQADALFAGCDALLAPSATGEAPAGLDATGDPVFCRGWTLLGLPCLHLPFARGGSGLPVGLQLVGRWGDDARLLAVGERVLALLG